MDGFTAVARLLTIEDRIKVLEIACGKLERDQEYIGGTGDLYQMIKELKEEKDQIIEKFRTVQL